MILSIDGATAIDGDSAALSNASDRRIYKALRHQTDAIVVGAKTADHPGYLKVRAQMVVVSASGAVPHPSYICVTTKQGEENARLRCDRVVVAGDHEVDLRLAWNSLRDLGLEKLLCEGGATLLSQLIRAGLVDDLFLTVAPLIVGNDSPRLHLPHPSYFRLVHLLEDSGYLFTRYAQTADLPDVGKAHPTDS